jgi:hypothetical protein
MGGILSAIFGDDDEQPGKSDTRRKRPQRRVARNPGGIRTREKRGPISTGVVKTAIGFSSADGMSREIGDNYNVLVRLPGNRVELDGQPGALIASGIVSSMGVNRGVIRLDTGVTIYLNLRD